MDLRNLMFKVGFQGDTAAVKKMDGATSKLGSAIEKTTDKLKGMEKSFGKVGKGLMKKVTAPLVGAGAAGTKMALDLEHGIKKVTTLADAEILPASKIKKEVREISDASGIAQTEVAEAAYSALSAGVDSANVMEFVRSGIDLTRAGFTDMDTAIDATTTVLNAYGENAFEVSKIHDIFVQTQDKGKISVDELGKSIGRVIPTASSLGVNLDQLGASYAILTAKGQNAQLATTNINAMLGELGSTGSKTDKALREMAGKSFAELINEGKSVGEALGMLDEYAIANNLSLKDMFGSMNAGSAAVTLLSDGVEGYNAMLKEMDGATGKTAKNAKTMEDGWFKIQKAMTQVKNTFIDVGGTIAPYIEKLAGTVSLLAGKFNALDPGTQTTAVRLLGLAAATGPVAFGISKVIGVMNKAPDAIKNAKTAINIMRGAINPTTIALGLLITGGVALYKNWDTISEKANSLRTQVLEKLKAATDSIKNKFEGFKGVLEKNKNVIQGTASALGVIFGPALAKTGIQAGIAGGKIATSFIANIAKTGAQAAVNGAKLTASFTTSVIKAGWQSAVSAGKITGSFMASLTKTGFEAAKTAAIISGQLVKSIVGYAMQGWKAVGSIAATTGAWLAQKAAMIGATIATHAMSAATFAWNTVAIVATGATTGLSAAIKFMTGPVGLTTLAIGALVAGGIALYKNWDKVSAWGKKAGASIKESWEGAKNKTIEAWDAMTSKIKGATGKIRSYWQGLKDFLKNPIKGTVNIGRNIWNRVTGKKPDGSHATGLDYIPKDNYLGNLHKGEMVLTAKTADKFRKLGGTKDSIPDVINTTNLSKANSNITNIDSSTHNIDSSNLTSNLVKSFANNKNIDEFINDVDNPAFNTIKNFASNKTINEGAISSIIRNITDKNSTVSNLVRNFTRNKYNKNPRTHNEDLDEYTYETYNNYKQENMRPETSKPMPPIIFKPQYDIEIKGDATRQEASDLANEIDKRVRKTFYDMFYELQLQMS